jgi:hypothetical protein
MVASFDANPHCTKTLLEGDLDADEEQRALFIEANAEEILDEFDKKSQQLSHELALQASDDISEMGDVSFGSFGSD